MATSFLGGYIGKTPSGMIVHYQRTGSG